MVGNQNKLLDREIGLMSREDKIREKLGEVGVCSSTVEVDNLREKLVLEKSASAYIIETFRNQIRFHKICNNAKSLTINGTLEEIIFKLKEYLAYTFILIVLTGTGLI